MEKRIKKYLDYLRNIDLQNISREEKQSLRADVWIQIQFFQHERLIHLIVTVTFAVLLMLAILGSCLFPNAFFLLLVLLLLILLIPYIRHYYILENGVQKIYTYYDEMTQ